MFVSFGPVMMSNLGHGFHHNGPEEHTKVGANDMHESDHRRVFAIIDDYIGVFEYEERLHEYEHDAGGLGHDAHYERDAALFNSRVIIEIGLDHLDQTEASIDHCGHGEYGRAHAHVQLARAVLVVVGEVEL